MKIDRRLLIYLIAGFIFATIIGTLSHEFGHYFVAKCFGYNAKIHNQYTTIEKPSPTVTKNSLRGLWFTLGGPLETMLTGTIGLIFLFVNYKSFKIKEKLSFMQWLLIFIALFWLRQTANFICWIGDYFLTGRLSTRSDEIHLAYYYKLSIWSVTTVTAFIGALVLAIVIFKFIPIAQRITFITSGLIGGILGFILWLIVLGPILMP